MKAFAAFILASLIGNFCLAQELKLDSVWTVDGQKFRVLLELDENSDINTSLSLFRNGDIMQIDSIWCSRLEVVLEDMDADGFDDLLIYQGSGARANETYHLFLYRKEHNDFRKVLGYNEWPNLEKTEIKGILASTILTATVEYRFFELNNAGELKDLHISVEDKSFKGKGYRKGIKEVRKLSK